MVPRAPSANGNGGARQREGTGRTAVRDVACAVLGLAITVAGLLLFYPAVVAFAHPLRYLAATALVCLFVVVWLAVWTCLEVVWTRRAGRPNGS